ncbi:helix-turn-helix domain-containing protein [Candidatus Sumerlaeota bacterium]|nr:helix-turn-helix domain-containing protein [Candidatus Sumerlaeales bacterium]NLD60924.1 helix-turn-helix domain-containing protein [Candidatus Sumerlaeota bacterium]
MFQYTKHKSTEVYYTVGEIAKMLNLSTKRVYQLIGFGRIKAVRISQRCIRVSDGDLKKFLDDGRHALCDSYYLPPSEISK